MRRQKLVLHIILFFFFSSLLLGFNLKYFSNDITNQIKCYSNSDNFTNTRVCSSEDLIVNNMNEPLAHYLNPVINNPLQTIEYNLATKTEKLGNNDSILTTQLQPIIPSFTGTLNEDYIFEESPIVKMSYPFPPDDRQKVTSTSSYPWRTICKLFITAQDNTQFIGSGFIVDEFHILTCGHCIYIHENGGWVSEVEVIPGMDGSFTPYGVAYATDYRTYTGWTESEMVEHDWALVTLDRNIGSYTGWMGRMTEGSSSSIYTGILNIAGYPVDLDNGYSMYFDSDDGEAADEYNHWFWMDTAPGQSGSPVWIYEGDNRYVISINTYEYENGAYANMGTRINNEKYNRLNTWLSEDSSSSPLDKPDLVDRGYDASINTDYVVAKETVFNIFSEVLNVGTASASSFEIDFYASKDTFLTGNDYLIGSVSIDSLAPYEYINADWSGVLPNMPTGYYNIGWKIDADNDIDELDENNNIVFDYYLQIYVKGKQDNSLITYILIPIFIAIGAVLAVAISIAIIRRRIPDLDIFLPLDEISTSVKPAPEPELSQQQSFIPQQSIKYCPYCGQKIIGEKRKFCKYCGSKF